MQVQTTSLERVFHITMSEKEVVELIQQIDLLSSNARPVYDQADSPVWTLRSLLNNWKPQWSIS